MKTARKDGLIWVTCSIRKYGEVVGQHNHMVKRGGLTTLCGHSASHPDIWVAQRSSKERCPSCLKVLNGGRIVTGARLAEPSKQSVYEEYFEVRHMGITHEAACQRVGLNPLTLADRIRHDRERGMDLPYPPEGYELAQDWTQPIVPGVRAWLEGESA